MRYYILIFCLVSLSTACKKETSSDTTQRKSAQADWMRTLVKNNPDKTITLSDISMPGAHDAGMYILQNCVGGNSCNTQTQYLPVKDMLEAGLRLFDIRPILFNNKYYTQHATDCNGLGCKGDQLDNILSQTKAFVDAHAELVFLELSHFCGLNAGDSAFIGYLRDKLGDRIYKETTPRTGRFIHKALTDFIPLSETKGKVLLIFDEGIASNAANRAAGLFTSNMLPIYGGWTDDNNFPELKHNQLTNYANYVNDSTKLFQFSWQITQDAAMAVACVLTPSGATSIEAAAKNANNQLSPMIDSLIGAGAIRKGRIPNIIYVDYADAFVTNICVKLSKLNVE